MLTLVVNWLIKPFTMAALGVLFFKVIFADAVPADDASQIIAGMILLGVAPCTAMVFVWSHLTEGDANYTLVQVSVNDLIMVVAFAPLAGLLLGVTDITVPWGTLITSVVMFFVIPLAAGVATQRALPRDRVERLGQQLKPTSILGLLLTVVLLFAFQAETLVARPLLVALIAVPLLLVSDGKPLHQDTLYHLGVDVGTKEAVINAQHRAASARWPIHKPARTTWRGTPLHEVWLTDPGGNLVEIYARLTDAELGEMPDDKEPLFLVSGA